MTVSGCPAASAGPRPSTNTVPPSAVTSLVVGNCGDDIVSPADLLHADRDLLERGRPRLLERPGAAAVGLTERDLHRRRAGGERPGDGETRAADSPRLRRSLERRGPGGAGRQVDDERAADVHPRARVVHDVEDVVDLQRVVVELHQDAAVAAEDDGALHRRARRRPSRLPAPAARRPWRSRPRGSRAGRPLAGTLNGCDTSASPSTVASARPSCPTGRPVNSARPFASVVAVTVFPPIVTRTVWPGASLPIDSRTTRTVTVPVGQLRRRQRAPVNQRGIRHLPWARAGAAVSSAVSSRTGFTRGSGRGRTACRSARRRRWRCRIPCTAGRSRGWCLALRSARREERAVARRRSSSRSICSR